MSGTRYGIAAITALLLVATISPRFLRFSDVSAIFLPGIIVGVAVALIATNLGTPPAFLTNRLWALPLTAFIGTLLLTRLLSAAHPGLHVSPVGAILAGICTVGLIQAVYLLFDAPEFPPRV